MGLAAPDQHLEVAVLYIRTVGGEIGAVGYGVRSACRPSVRAGGEWISRGSPTAVPRERERERESLISRAR